MEKIDEKLLSNAQYRKSLSIAFFNATNAAIELVKNTTAEISDEKEMIVKWRDWFLEQHKNYHATVIAQIGVNYRASETIEKLKVAKTLDELKEAWQSLSEDERRDGEIIKATQQLKLQYEKK